MLIQPEYANIDLRIYRRIKNMSILMTISFFVTFYSGAIVAGTRAGFVDFKYQLD